MIDWRKEVIESDRLLNLVAIVIQYACKFLQLEWFQELVFFTVTWFFIVEEDWKDCMRVFLAGVRDLVMEADLHL